jgi:hypothetical protein
MTMTMQGSVFGLTMVMLLTATICGADENTAEISGIVLDASRGLPVAGAKVQIDFDATVQSDEAGLFSFTALKAGTHSLTTEKTGFAKRAGHGATFVNLSSGEKVTGLTLRLTAEAVLSGRVTNWRGEPVEAWIEVTDANGPGHVASALTQNGQFCITGLPEGKYKLSAQGSGPDRTRTAVTWYPGETELEKAEPIPLSAGEQCSLVPFALRESQYVTVNGHFEGQLPPWRRCSVRYERPDGAPVGIQQPGWIDPNGKFTLQVPPGELRLKAQCDPNGEEQPVVIGYRDLKNGDHSTGDFVIPASIIRSVRGRFRWADGRADSIVATFSLNPTQHLGILQHGRIQPDGFIEAKDASPDIYVVLPENLPERVYVRSILADGFDITFGGLDLLNQNRTDLDIILGDDGAALSGDVASAEGAPQLARVWASRKSESVQQRFLWSRELVCDSQGHFHGEGLAPGDYSITARTGRKNSETKNVRLRPRESASVQFNIP